MTAPNPDPHDPAIAAYLAARTRKGATHVYHQTVVQRLRRACLTAVGAPCHLCGSTHPHRLLSTRSPSWDAAAAAPGHAALLQRTPRPQRLARYAAAAASPRVKPVCPGCLPSARLHSQLEALHAACHGPNHARTGLCTN